MSGMILPLAAVFGATFFGGFLQSITGFGFGLVTVPLLSLFLEVRIASTALVFSSLVLNGYLMLRLRKHFKREGMIPVMIATACGVPAGVMFLKSVNEHILTRALGGVLALFILYSLIPKKTTQGGCLHPVYVGIPLGLFSGALAGAYALGGPPAVAYIGSKSYHHERHVVSIQVLLCISAVIRLVFVGAAGLIDSNLVVTGACALGGVITGSSVALFIRSKPRPVTMRRIILVMLAILSIKYLCIG